MTVFTHIDTNEQFFLADESTCTAFFNAFKIVRNGNIDVKVPLYKHEVSDVLYDDYIKSIKYKKRNISSNVDN
jgi:hypothetical protein